MNKTTQKLYDNLPDLPKDEKGSVFNEPWQAQAFALAVSLCDEGHFTWSEWVDVFSEQVKLAQQSGDPDLGDTYYSHWLNALEVIVSNKQIVGLGDMKERKEAWRQVYLHTPHGKPIELHSFKETNYSHSAPNFSFTNNSD